MDAAHPAPTASTAAPLLSTQRTRLRAVEPSDTGVLRAMRATPAVAQWWHEPEPDWPFEDFPGASRWVVELRGTPTLGPDGALAGYVQAFEESTADNDVCGIDLFLAGSLHRHGLGREVVTAVRDWLVEVQGHHLVQIDPAAENEPAIACYRACGFRPVGVLHGYERDPYGEGWHDTLLMEYAVPWR